jgi:hypothetical protein
VRITFTNGIDDVIILFKTVNCSIYMLAMQIIFILINVKVIIFDEVMQF